ncbi:RNA-processing protein [Archaeoglobales archaeon ex4484_92]|nr:MAG: RNA-processing protein [Archaeoglobales archaeon ex4484_92]
MNSMNVLELEVPEDRIGVLIGKNGEIKRTIEKKTGCKLRIMSDIKVARIECEDPIGFMRAKDVIKAISIGFNPEIALKLMDDEMLIFDVIDLSSYIPEKAMHRIKGRIIGKEGKIRRQIEEVLDVNLTIYGKFIGIIGYAENVSAAREAITMIIDGAQHSRVIKFMERKRREMRSRSLDWL